LSSVKNTSVSETTLQHDAGDVRLYLVAIVVELECVCPVLEGLPYHHAGLVRN
jgi:hypothetical protein